MKDAHTVIQSILTGIGRIQEHTPSEDVPDDVLAILEEADETVWTALDELEEPTV